MKLHCLGTGGYHPNDNRHTACFYLPEQGIVLDAGSAMFRLFPLLKPQSKPLHIFLTHAHLDHIVGLTFLLQLKNVGDKSDQPQVTVHAEAAKIEAIQTHLFSELLFPLLPPITFQPLDGSIKGPIDLDGCQVSWFELRHPGGSVGFRVDCEGKRLAYVTDTTADEKSPYIEQIRDVDLLIHECYFSDEEEEIAELTGHSCATQVGRVAEICGAKQLLIVHLNPTKDNEQQLLSSAKSVFPNTMLATDHLTLEI